MPESVTDRCTKSHEYIFLLSKSQRYYFDHEEIQEEANYDGRKDLMMHGSQKYADAEIMPNAKPNTMSQRGHERWQTKSGHKFGGNKYGQNDDSHFQTYSGKEWTPQTKNCQYDGQEPNSMHLRREQGLPDEVYFVRNKRDVWSVNLKPNKETHFATYPEMLIRPCILAGCPEKGIVLDPFMGSGTTGIVARKLNRNYIGCELNPEYKAMAERRIEEYGENLFNQ